MNRKKPPETSTARSSGAASGRCPDFASVVRESTDDASLFEQIAECFSKSLEEFATYYCKDQTLGKDAFQDAMIIAIRSLPGYRGDSPIEPWLRRIVMTSCSRLRRGKKNDTSINTSLDAAGGQEAFAGDEPNQEMAVIMAQALDQVRQEIEKLSEPNRSLLMRHDVQEESIASLALDFQMTDEAIKSRLKRSRATIRENILQVASV